MRPRHFLVSVVNHCVYGFFFFLNSNLQRTSFDFFSYFILFLYIKGRVLHPDTGQTSGTALFSTRSIDKLRLKCYCYRFWSGPVSRAFISHTLSGVMYCDLPEERSVVAAPPSSLFVFPIISVLS